MECDEDEEGTDDTLILLVMVMEIQTMMVWGMEMVEEMEM